jgi:hypothetical protein
MAEKYFVDSPLVVYLHRIYTVSEVLVVSMDAFRAGIVPGGLTSTSHIRTLLLFIINNYESPIPQSVIVTSLTTTGIVNYFDCIDSLKELSNLNLVAGNDDGYILTDTGRSVVNTLHSEIPLTVRTKAVEAIRQNMLLHVNTKQHNTLIEKLDDGYLVHCNLADPDSVIFSLSLYAPNYEIAQKIKKNFIYFGEKLIDGIIAEMTKDMDEE